jgi:hypothetical protein
MYAELAWLLPAAVTKSIEGGDMGYVASHVLELHPDVLRACWSFFITLAFPKSFIVPPSWSDFSYTSKTTEG